jgi:glycosyltransferase involved in cell wall biosynthesis
VVLTGYQHDARLAGLLEGARLFVQPSLLEGLPIALLEATAYGLPVLASDIPPHLEVLGRTGPGRTVFAAGDRAGLVRELQVSLDTPEATLRAGADQLKAETRARYDWEVATDLLEQVYRRAVARRRTGLSAGGQAAHR